MWRIPQFPADMISFTTEILNGKLQFLRSNMTIWKYVCVTLSGLTRWSRYFMFLHYICIVFILITEKSIIFLYYSKWEVSLAISKILVDVETK